MSAAAIEPEPVDGKCDRRLCAGGHDLLLRAAREAATSAQLSARQHARPRERATASARARARMQASTSTLVKADGVARRAALEQRHYPITASGTTSSATSASGASSLTHDLLTGTTPPRSTLRRAGPSVEGVHDGVALAPCDQARG